MLLTDKSKVNNIIFNTIVVSKAKGEYTHKINSMLVYVYELFRKLHTRLFTMVLIRLKLLVRSLDKKKKTSIFLIYF